MQEKVQRGNTKLAVKAGFWYVASTFLVKSIAFITTPIFARLMSETAYGEFSNFASWLVTLLIITGAELYNTVSRAYYDYTEDYDEYISSITITSCGVTALVYFIFLFCRGWILDIVAIPEQYIHVLFIVLLFQSCKQIYMARERTLYRYKSVALISVINLVIPTLIAIVLVVIAPEAERLSARIYGYYVPSAMIGMICMTLLLIKGKAFKLEHCKYAFKLSLPMIVHYLTAYLLTSSNTIITKSIMGAASAAVVSIASSTIHILTVLFQSLSGAVTTWLMDNLQQNNAAKLRRDTLVYVGLLGVVASGVILLAPEVVLILGGQKYLESITLIPGLVVAVYIQAITSIFTTILTYDKNLIKTAVCTTVVAVLSIVIKIVLVPIYSFQVLPYVNIVAFGSLYVANYILITKAGYSKFVNIKGITGVIIGLILMMISSFVLYEHFVLRYIVIGMFGVAALVALFKNITLLKKVINKKMRRKN